MCHVIVCPDCTLLPAPTSGVEPVFCVELKPKQGFLSQGHQHCPFCLNQFLKVPFSLLAKYGTLSRDGNNTRRESVAIVFYPLIVTLISLVAEARKDPVAQPVLPPRSLFRVRPLLTLSSFLLVKNIFLI